MPKQDNGGEAVCRVLPHEVGHGPRQMALDEALLDAVAADPREAVIRTYSWSIPTLSLGYFQTIAEAESDPRWAGVPIVRRPTGGGALWHDREVTYALVVPGTHPSARPSSALYRAVHEAIAARLRDRGIPAARRGPVTPTDGPRPFLCFTDRDSEDVVCSGAKIVGSAQRRRAGAVLQHGSLLLSRSPTTPELPGLADLAPVDPAESGWREFLLRALSDALGLRFRDDGLRPDEAARAAQLERDAYGHPSWTRRR
ncbi:lipoate--protein ligase family protein [Tundrisphaera sp. TA3]|uniref:lipoate--protein ligase family protein n=1 Tax=Tundrisphaera sp. TA3 TaxID=3435775 RepID=UPI003EB9E3F7